MSLKNTLAKIIRAERGQSGLSQDKIASKAGISTRYYQAIEAAEKQPSLDTIFKLCHAFECDYIKILAPVWTEWLKNPEE